MSSDTLNIRPQPDQVLVDIADYVLNYAVTSKLAYDTARYCLIDTLGCGLEALRLSRLHQAARAHRARNGGAQWRAACPGTGYQLDPVQAAFNIGDDDPLAGLQRHLAGGGMGAPFRQSRRHSRHRRLAVPHAASRRARPRDHARRADGHDQGARDPGLPRAGELLQQGRARSRRAGQSRVDGGGRADARPVRATQIINALSLAWVDGQALRTYRHAPNTGSRKSWAAGDATSRAVRLALMAKTGEMGYPSALTAKTWGFYDVSFPRRSRSSSSGLTAAT